MPPLVWILDSSWPLNDLETRGQEFSFLKWVNSQAEIKQHIRQLVKDRQPLAPDSFWFVHHSDVVEIAGDLDPLLQNSNFRLFSGASAGAHEGMLPRNLVSRQLDDFLRYWDSGDKQSAVQILTQPDWQIDRIRVWIDRVQHDYINLLAPIDLLALAFTSGEIDEDTYRRLRGQLTDRLIETQKAFMRSQSDNLRNMSRVFEEVVHLSQASDPIAKGSPSPLPAEDRLASIFTARILHVDDEIDKGWDLVMPALFDHYEYVTDPEQVVPKVQELESSGDPYLVLLDLGLKSGDSPVPKAWRGLDLLRLLRKKYPAAPIYVLSARQDMHTYRQVIETRGNGFIHKPCRALASVADRQLFARFRSQVLNARFDIFRSFLYRALSDFQMGVDQNTISLPFSYDAQRRLPEADQRRQSINLRLQNIRLALETLLGIDFERSVRDQEYADAVIRNLVLALYRPLETTNDPDGGPTAERPHWKLRILKKYRNICAHIGEGTDIANLDIRDAMIVAQLALDPDVLSAPLPDTISNHLSLAFDELFVTPRPADFDHTWQEAQNRPKPATHFLRTLQQVPPKGSARSHSKNDRRLLALIADKIIHPSVLLSEIAFLNPTVPFDAGPTQPYQPTSEAFDTPTTHAASPALPKRTPPTLKGMEYFFCRKEGNLMIDFGRRYYGVQVDGADPAQREFFTWYFDKNMKNQLHRYTGEVLEFLRSMYGVGPGGSAGSTQASPSPNISPAQSVESPSPSAGEARDGCDISLFPLISTPNGNLTDHAVSALLSGIPGARIDAQRRGIVLLNEVQGTNGNTWMGVHIRVREQFPGDQKYLQITPTQQRSADSDEALVSLPYTEARRLIMTAAGTISWIDANPVNQAMFEQHGRYDPPTGADKPLDRFRLQQIFRHKRLAIVDETGGSATGTTADWREGIERSLGVPLTSADQADAIVVVIPERSPEDLLSGVRERWGRCGRPWKVVSPGARFKDWNVLVALGSRFGTTLEPIVPYRPRDPDTLFLGLDIGHKKASRSVIAATLVNSSGQLVGWTHGPNEGPVGQYNPEKIDLASFRSILDALVPRMEQVVNRSNLRLVVHRDGRTLESIDDFQDVLQSDYGIRDIDWLDVDKQRAPLFFLDAGKPTGHFAIFENRQGQAEMWVRTSPGGSSLYSRPLCLVPRTTETDLETLGLQVFDLSNAAAQDYEMKNKLPVTTYLADGFCATGSKSVQFWGYEHLRCDRA